MGTILIWATAWAFVALVARMVAQPGRGGGGGGGGRRLRAELDAIYGGEHEYARVSPAAFPDADLGYYDRCAAELEAMGYRRVADIEDLTLSRIYPERRTFLRVLVDEGGAIRAAVYHLRVRGGGFALLSAVGIAPRDIYVCEMVTESPRGHFVATSNTKGLDKLTTPKEVEVERLEIGASLAQVVARHRARLTERARRRGADAPVAMWTWEDVLASIQRGHVASAKHRQAVGGLSREEVERFTGRPLNAGEESFLREVRGEAPVAAAGGVKVAAIGNLGVTVVAADATGPRDDRRAADGDARARDDDAPARDRADDARARDDAPARDRDDAAPARDRADDAPARDGDDDPSGPGPNGGKEGA